MAGGVIFMGVGIGVAASGTVVPLLLQRGLQATWLGLALLSLALSAIAWKGWPADAADAAGDAHHAAPAASAAARHRPPASRTLRALYVEYALNAAGWVPHMIFLVDFVARGLGRGVQVGADYWVLFGIGATVGPLFAGALADRVGFGRALRIAFALQIVGVAIPALGAGAGIGLMVSSVVVGAFVTGTVPLVLGRVHELLAHHPARQNGAWRTATVGFALCQAVAAYGLSFLFSRDGDYRLLFVIGASAMAIALAIDVAAGASAPRRQAARKVVGQRR